jgi:hypothetical protein
MGSERLPLLPAAAVFRKRSYSSAHHRTILTWNRQAIAHSLSVALVGLSNFVAAAPPKRSTLAFAPGATSGADLQTGFVVKLGDQVQMTDMPSPSIRVQHEIMVHKD